MLPHRCDGLAAVEDEEAGGQAPDDGAVRTAELPTEPKGDDRDHH
jgi:hypothetical protein